MLFRSAGLLFGLWMAAFIPATAAPPPAQVDACNMIDLASINAAAKAWFGLPVTLTTFNAWGARRHVRFYDGQARAYRHQHFLRTVRQRLDVRTGAADAA